MSTFGYVDIARHRVLAARGQYLHVFYRGEDVTNRCESASDEGDREAVLFRRNADWKMFIDPLTGNAAREVVTGVTIQVRACEP